MKFLVDAQLPPGLCDWLEERGYEAVHVGTLAKEALRDWQIAEYAEGEQLSLRKRRYGYGSNRGYRLCQPKAGGRARPGMGAGAPASWHEGGGRHAELALAPARNVETSE